MNNMTDRKPMTPVVLIGRHENIIKELTDRGISCIVLDDNTDIDSSVRNHADMASYALSDGSFILDQRQKNACQQIKKLGYNVILTENYISGEYPTDIVLNAARIGDTVICNQKFISREILGDAKKVISVRQGYTKCSVCIVNERAFITDDVGIYEKCRDRFDVLLVEKGDIFLEGKEYGFIGGASALINGKIYFFGSLSYHRDGENIACFLKKHNAEYECLFDAPLVDIGGATEIK